MITYTKRVVAVVALLLWGAAAQGAWADAAPSFEREIVPILRAHCIKCHGPNKPKAKLNLASPRAMARGGESGPAIVAGRPADSLLWDQVSKGDMPPRPEEPLSAADKESLRRWIERGALGLPDPAQAGPTAATWDHWAFAPPSHPRPPAVRDARNPRGPVDAFIERALEDRGLTLGPAAGRATLIRRLTFDLTGLPPSLAEIRAFAGDPRPDAYRRLVDRLLASPRYGERWGKLWLDASGYADSNGYFSADSDRALSYRYRDYVIRAFNTDRPLDQIVREGLAGDELAGGRRGPGTPPEVIDQLVATHFLRNSQDGTGESDGNPDEVKADKYAVLEGTAQIIGTSLLGLTIQCARCHDHKFEPITQEDYYRLQAILYPAFNIEHWVKPDERMIIAGPAALLLRWEAHDKAIDAELAALRRSFVTGSDAQKKAKEEVLKPVIEKIESRRRPNPGRIAGVVDVSADPPEIPILVRGGYRTPGRKVGPGVPAFLADPDNPYRPEPRTAVPGSSTTGRRAALARWLTKPGSRPATLLARVLANRIWQDHFGTGIVATPENLGYTGASPSHPELLEFLAAELVRSGWSTKALHRMIVTSAAYRQSSAPRALAERIDPDNRLLGRYPLRRLDAESIRDAMLVASAELDDRPGGPYVPTNRTDSGEVAVDPSTPGARRRSVYLQQRRTQVASMLEVFDAPSIVVTCTRRQPSTVPLQSLSLLNSDFVAACAARLVERLGPERDDCGQDDDRIDRAFLLVIGRTATGAERIAAGRFLREQPARYPGSARPESRRRAFIDFCQMLLASNAFLYIE
jgi:mono/diheme cytochrome c family protein